MGSLRTCYCVESSEQSSAKTKAGYKNHSATTRVSYHGWCSTPDASCPGARKVVTEGRHLRDCTARSLHRKFVQFGEKVLNGMNLEMWLGVWINSASWAGQKVFSERARGQEDRTAPWLMPARTDVLHMLDPCSMIVSLPVLEHAIFSNMHSATMPEVHQNILAFLILFEHVCVP